LRQYSEILLDEFTEGKATIHTHKEVSKSLYAQSTTGDVAVASLKSFIQIHWIVDTGMVPRIDKVLAGCSVSEWFSLQREANCNYADNWQDTINNCSWLSKSVSETEQHTKAIQQ
jgi:hypothetical protein